MTNKTVSFSGFDRSQSDLFGPKTAGLPGWSNRSALIRPSIGQRIHYHYNDSIVQRNWRKEI